MNNQKYIEILKKVTGDDEIKINKVLSSMPLDDLNAIVDNITSYNIHLMAQAKIIYDKYKNNIGESFQRDRKMNTSNVWLNVKNSYKTKNYTAVTEAVKSITLNDWKNIWPKMGKAMLVDLFANSQERNVQLEDYDFSEQILAEAYFHFINRKIYNKPFTTPTELVEGLINKDRLVSEGYTHFISLQGTDGDNLMDFLEEEAIDYLVDLDGNFNIKLDEKDFISLESYLANNISEATDEGNINAPNWTLDSKGQYKGDTPEPDIDGGERNTMANKFSNGGESIDTLLDDDLFAVDADGVSHGEAKFVKTGDAEVSTGNSSETEYVQDGGIDADGNEKKVLNQPTKSAPISKPKEETKPAVKAEPKVEPKKEETVNDEVDDTKEPEENKDEKIEKKDVSESLSNILKNAGILTESSRKNPAAKALTTPQYAQHVEKSKKGKEQQADSQDRNGKYKKKPEVDECMETFHIGDRVMVGEDEGAVKITNGPAGTIGVIINGEIRMVEAKDVKTISESVIGFTGVPDLLRMRELAGMHAGVINEFSTIGNEVDTSEIDGGETMPVPTDDLESDISPEIGDDEDFSGTDLDDFGSEGDTFGGEDDYEPLPSELSFDDDVDGSGVDDDINSEIGDDGMPSDISTPITPDAGIPGSIGSDPMASIGGLAPTSSEAYTLIQDNLNTIQSKLSEVRISEYKALVQKLNDLANQVKSMGADYLGGL